MLPPASREGDWRRGHAHAMVSNNGRDCSGFHRPLGNDINNIIDRIYNSLAADGDRVYTSFFRLFSIGCHGNVCGR